MVPKPDSDGHLYQDVVVTGRGNTVKLGNSYVFNGPNYIEIKNSDTNSQAHNNILNARLSHSIDLFSEQFTTRVYIGAGICFLCGLLFQNIEVKRLLTSTPKNDPQQYHLISIIAGLLMGMFSIRVLQGPSVAGDSVIHFENVFGKQSLVPLSYFASTDILMGFLQTRYKGSVAEKYISAGLYNIKTDSRSGRVINVVDLFHKSRLKRNSWLTMSILCAVDEVSCPDCDGGLTGLGIDLFLW